MLSRNDVLTEVLARTAALDLPGWYVTAGCLFQTVWNVVTEKPPTSGIKDYDVFYFDGSDLSWEAEDSVIQAAGGLRRSACRGRDQERGTSSPLVRGQVRCPVSAV
ncbi:hypothetical protein GCM10010372_04300 [Streptomyces tauricus]|nr:hypothetical protein GCM10010372_04300 [Streptomyces tauricus]